MLPSDALPSSDVAPNARALLLAVKVRSFRAFRDEASFNLRPLTLLYGHNQAGKSSLLRLISLIADSLHPGTPALDLQSPSLRGASFKELGWMGRAPAFSPWLKVLASATTPAPTLVLQYADDGGMVVNQVQLIRGDGDKFVVSLDSDVRREPGRTSARYAGKYRGAEWSGILSFSRLLPEGLPEEAAEIAREVDAALQPIIRTQWLHANRLADGAQDARQRYGGQADGSDLAARLSEPRYRAVLEEASAWIAAHPELGSEVALDVDSTGRPRFILGFPGRERLPLYLAGEGMRALLPILLYACWAERGHRDRDSNAPSLLAIEEPEAHLHPHLQVALFERLLATVRAGVPVVLETHSVYVLRAMQIAVLQGQLDPTQVGLHWVGQDDDGAASVTPVEIRTDATLSGWRPLAFEKEQELAHQILDLRWKRQEAT
ncbi:AAA family ATPase [Sorangium sp. So ce448]|uniref:AAA family ATPase n=1 Tax=Sorangium sp. So ce448 TaxID=3133314 RepID=UPI003F5D8AC7